MDAPFRCLEHHRGPRVPAKVAGLNLPPVALRGDRDVVADLYLLSPDGGLSGHGRNVVGQGDAMKPRKPFKFDPRGFFCRLMVNLYRRRRCPLDFSFISRLRWRARGAKRTFARSYCDTTCGNANSTISIPLEVWVITRVLFVRLWRQMRESSRHKTTNFLNARLAKQ
jgi:hypothetical protein